MVDVGGGGPDLTGEQVADLVDGVADPYCCGLSGVDGWGFPMVAQVTKNPDGPSLTFTRDDWAAFVKRVKDGDHQL